LLGIPIRRSLVAVLILCAVLHVCPSSVDWL
jgi:hypothetical protein